MRPLASAATFSGSSRLVDVEESRQPPLREATATPRLSLEAGDIAARVAAGVLFTIMTIRLGSDFLHTGRLTGLLLLASEALVVILTVFRRSTGIVNRSGRARTLMVVSLVGPVLVVPSSVPALLPGFVTVMVSVCGLLVVIAGKLSLGRSFGLMPANRGVVSSGMYRFVRHPIYSGYLLTHAAFCAANPTLGNLLVLVGADVALAIRALCEEQTLAADAAYRAYQQQVRWRVLPGLF
ncbi:MAG: isoprenylcysteine carboxylmethyltransferase family protein [Acidobacteriota bacterium]